MSEVKFTPGPWHTGGTSFLKKDDPRMNVCTRRDSGGQSGEIIAKGVKPPNARLMAAAPDMLAALKAQEAAGAAIKSRVGYSEWRALEDLAKGLRIAAINKAEGR